MDKWSASLDGGSRQSQIESAAIQFWSLVLVLAYEGTLSAGDRAVAVRELARHREALAPYVPSEAPLASSRRRHAKAV